MAHKHRAAFITARKGFCYLTVKCGRRNFPVMRIRNYALEAQEKRDMRRLYPDVVFDWKKLDRQLAEKRVACRSYRARRRSSNAARAPRRGRESISAVFDPATSTVYATGMPSSAAGAAALLDAVLRFGRHAAEADDDQTIIGTSSRSVR